jgi:anaerobic magnesium-protoporphyrin IX monomethyl ester cyclase
MKVVLITPPYDKNRFRLGESLGLKYLAAVLRQHEVEVSVFEPTLLGWDVQDTVKAIVSHGCDILGISVQFSHGLSNAVEVMREVKSSINPHITVGGHFATFHYNELLETIPYLDTVVRFEGEETLVELVRCLNQPSAWSNVLGLAYRDNTAVRATPPRPLIQNLDSLPFPERDATSRLAGDPHYGMIASRGCLLCCSFCSVPFFYNEPQGSRWRVRSPHNVVDEIEMLVSCYGAQEISFFDDNFIGSNKFGRKRAAQIAQAILDRRLSIRWSIECRVDDVDRELFETLIAAGLQHVNLGIESGVQSVLDGFKKLTTVEENRNAINLVRELGLSAYYHYIMFNPNTTLDELDLSLDFIKECGIGSFSVIANRLDLYKGTTEFYKVEKEGRLIKRGYEYGFRFLDPAVEYVYQAIYRGLIPLYDAEMALNRAVFAEATTKRSYLRNHFLFPRANRTGILDWLARKLSDKTVEMTKEIVRYFKQHKSVTKRDLDRFVQSLYDESKKFSEEMIQEVIHT